MRRWVITRIPASRQNDRNRRLESTPAGHIDKGAGGIGSLIRQQPQDGVGDFFSSAAALHRYRVLEAIDTPGFTAAGMNVGVDQAGANGIDANAFSSHFLGQADGEGIDGALRGSVVDVF